MKAELEQKEGPQKKLLKTFCCYLCIFLICHNFNILFELFFRLHILIPVNPDQSEAQRERGSETRGRQEISGRKPLL